MSDAPLLALPPVAAPVVAEVLDQLPPRLRKRLDAALAVAATWTVTSDDVGCTVAIDADATLTMRLTTGVLLSAADLTCCCLLAPACLHRAVAVSLAPVADTDVAMPQDAAEPAPSPAEPRFSADEVAAADVLWKAAVTVVRSGLPGAGAIAQAELLRGVHAARIVGLHRASSAGLKVVAGLRAARANDPDFRLAGLTGELCELLLVCHGLRRGVGEPVELRGSARRTYRPLGALRLYGLCTETVVSASGYAGVVTHVVDEAGGLWSIPSIAPGGPERVRAAAEGPLAVGESGLTHRELSRSGLLLQSATASLDRRLGAGASVRAVAASGATWTDQPHARLWQEPLADQVRRAFAAQARPQSARPSGDELLFLDATALGTTGDALRVAVREHGREHKVDLVGDGAVAWENLRLLAGHRGLRLLVVARLLAHLPSTATAVAVTAEGNHLQLPEQWQHRVDLGLDRLQRSYLPGEQAERALLPHPPREHETPVGLLDRWLERVVSGGRRMLVVGSPAPDRARLARAGLSVASDLLYELESTARNQRRDTFGRLADDKDDRFVLAWLRGCVYAREFTRTTAMTAWLDAT